MSGRKIDLDREQVVKLFPANPPRKGEGVLVDGVRSRVTRVRVQWQGHRWTITDLRVRALGGDGE